jgi:hypothetical protein
LTLLLILFSDFLPSKGKKRGKKKIIKNVRHQSNLTAIVKASPDLMNFGRFYLFLTFKV